MGSAQRRIKLSTTISRESYTYLRRQRAAGKASSMGQAVDIALKRVRRIESRSRLERDTAAYFENLTGAAAREESRLGTALGAMTDEVDFES